MNRPILVCTLFVAVSAALGAQEASQTGPYQGTSNPPPDDQIITSATPAAKPPAGQPVYIQPVAPAQGQVEPQPGSVNPEVNYQEPGSENSTMQAAPGRTNQPVLTERNYPYDPDGDIVHPHPLRRGEIEEGTIIRVRLLNRLSTVQSEKGEAFRTRVATDVLAGGEVRIPAGAEIDGRLVEVSSGHAGGHGSMRLQPEVVILPDGTRYRLRAELSGTPGSRTHVGSEGTVLPNSRIKRDSIEYGGAVGAGAVTGAFMGGPVGALAGSLIGAGVITVHLLVSHPQATLESGTALLLTLTEPLYMVPAREREN
jgi:hypothetical protein